LPDTIALEGTGLVREVLDEVLAQNPDDHLTAWRQITKPSNLGRKSIHRYSRLFELQHYCRALNDRHHAALVGNRERLRLALAKFLKTGPDTIRDDIRLIRRRFATADAENIPAWLDLI
jgi:hypothetical protein